MPWADCLLALQAAYIVGTLKNLCDLCDLCDKNGCAWKDMCHAEMKETKEMATHKCSFCKYTFCDFCDFCVTLKNLCDL